MRLIFAGLVFTMAAFTQTDAAFQKIYDSYLAALKTNNFQAVKTQVSSELWEQFTSWAPPSKRAGLMASIAKDTVPSSYEVQFVRRSKDGKKASMMVVGMFAPDSFHAPEGGPEEKAEATISFVQKAGVWKVGDVKIDRNLSTRPKPQDLNMGQREDYRDAVNTRLGGVILRLEKQAAGTVYVIKVVDEEDAVFLPEAKVSPDFVRGAIVFFDASQHEHDPLKYWAESAELKE